MSRSPTGQTSERTDLDFERNPGLLELLGRELGMGIFTVDAAGRFVSWSPGAEEITGYFAREVRGQPCEMFSGPNCKGFSGLAQLLASPDPTQTGMRNQECRVYSKESRELHLLGSARIVRDDTGAVFGAIGAFADLTKILRLNAPVLAAATARGLAGLIGSSAPMEEVFRRIQLAADSDVTTLITGESGTGKELAARAIHTLSERAEKPFVAVNCSALPEGLLESELFGHVRGAFTGAVRDRQGVFETANGGTLLLDEIGDVSPLLQLKLLRVLQEREIHRVGAEGAIPVDVRLLTATNRDLQERVSMGRIRADFFYRIRVFEIHMPALRERPGDVAFLAQQFVAEVSRTHKKTLRGIAQDALEALAHAWPGNVRELHNAIEHAMVVQKGALVGLLDLPADVRGAPVQRARALAERALTPVQEAERLHILGALEAHGWNRTRTAQGLGVSRVTLWKKMRRYQLHEGDESVQPVNPVR